eukprot:366568-Chlamydomonas_euryale.AAC.17
MVAVTTRHAPLQCQTFEFLLHMQDACCKCMVPGNTNRTTPPCMSSIPALSTCHRALRQHQLHHRVHACKHI